MGDFVASTIQQQVKIYDTPLEYQADIFQFFQMAQAKHARLAVLPALSPLMLIPPLASRTRLDQLKKSQGGKGVLSSLVEKLFGKASPATDLKTAGIKEELVHLLNHYPGEIYDAYIDLFSAAALKHQMTIVAGSFYLREYENAECAHISYVFGPNGMILGRQKKIHLTNREKAFCQAGQTLQVIDTPVGRLGILIEEDTLYPECGRVLAYNGVDILINLTACIGKPMNNQMRNAFLARVDENGVLGIQSCLVGNDLFEPDGEKLVGKAALLQPFQLSAYGDGIMFEVGSAAVEGFIAESMSINDLKDHWVRAKHRLRQGMQMIAYRSLADIYRQQRTLDQVYWNLSEETPRTSVQSSAVNFPPFTPQPASLFTSASDTEDQGEERASDLTSPFVQDDEG